MHERLAARRETVMSRRKDALLDSLENLATQLDLLGRRLDVEMLQRAAGAYRQARQAILVTEANEADLLCLFHTLNQSTEEIGALLRRFGVSLGATPSDPES